MIDDRMRHITQPVDGRLDILGRFDGYRNGQAAGYHRPRIFGLGS